MDVAAVLLSPQTTPRLAAGRASVGRSAQAPRLVSHGGWCAAGLRSVGGCNDAGFHTDAHGERRRGNELVMSCNWLTWRLWGFVGTVGPRALVAALPLFSKRPNSRDRSVQGATGGKDEQRDVLDLKLPGVGGTPLSPWNAVVMEDQPSTKKGARASQRDESPRRRASRRKI